MAVVDSGIDPNAKPLSGWVHDRNSYVASPVANPTHGTFVAGLIVHGDRLNPQLPDISNDPCGVIDVEVIPNSDPDYGDVDFVYESEFLEALESALEEHADTCSVWNLSLSSDEPCSDDEFSTLAAELDDLQERFSVTFVIAAGNYETRPLLAYPRTGDELTRGRITAPADSVLGVTVGAISHVDYPDDRGPSMNEASPFSRHGSGPNYVIKPDLVHYGGSCTTDASHLSGVRSITGTGCGEDIGTSFATPLVSRSLAQIYHRVEPTPSPELARALLVHNARDPRSGERVPPDERDFLGFGRPAAPPLSLGCSPHEMTLIFRDVVQPGLFKEWDAFPYPPSLIRAGRYFGEILLTVAFTPIRGDRWGLEYCETHVEALFGTYTEKVNTETGEVTESFKTVVGPEQATGSGEGQLERRQVRERRKWAPVRTYYRKAGPKGIPGTRWRLRVNTLARHVEEMQRERQEQPFALILTISDPNGTAPVYDEMAQAIRFKWQVEDLALRVGARIRAQS